MKNLKNITIPIRGMHCRSCELLLEEKIRGVQGVLSVSVSYRDGLAHVGHGDDIPSGDEISQAVESCGYSVGTESKGSVPWLAEDASVYRNVGLGALILVALYLVARGLGLTDFSLAQNDITVPFALIIGLVAGVSTCMAMVGGLVLAISARHSEMHPEATSWQKFRPHLFFNIGRIFGYAGFGAVLGFIGSAIQPSSGFLAILTIAVAAIMIYLGLKLTNLSPKIANTSITLPSGLAKLLGMNRHQKEYSHQRAMTLGALTFFLPCGFPQAVQVFAVGTGDPKTAALLLGAFALGTSPALLGVGGLTAIIKKHRDIFYATVGVAILLFGAFNLSNGVGILGVGNGKANATENPAKVAQKTNGTQVIKMTQAASGYSPNRFTITAGVPVRWEINSTNSFTCASSLIVPALNVAKTLKPGLNVLEFTPSSPGAIPFSCSMGMYRGQITVVAGDTTTDTAKTTAPAPTQPADTWDVSKASYAYSRARGSAFFPSELSVTVGAPTEWTVITDEASETCKSVISEPLKIRAAQYPEGGTVIRFIPDKKGVFAVTCENGELRGTVRVQ